MNTKRIAQFVVAVVLTFATVVGSGVVAEQIGWAVGTAVYACGTSAGGGC